MTDTDFTFDDINHQLFVHGVKCPFACPTELCIEVRHQDSSRRVRRSALSIWTCLASWAICTHQVARVITDDPEITTVIGVPIPIADAKLDLSLVKSRNITLLHFVPDLVAHLTLASQGSSTVLGFWP